MEGGVDGSNVRGGGHDNDRLAGCEGRRTVAGDGSNQLTVHVVEEHLVVMRRRTYPGLCQCDPQRTTATSHVGQQPRVRQRVDAERELDGPEPLGGGSAHDRVVA